MKISIKSLIIITAALILVGAAFFYFVLEKKRTRNPENRVATLSFFKNSVEERYAGNIQWKSALSNDSLFEEDAIKTHSDSEALITFKDNASIKVDENSIIIIRKMEEDASGAFPNFEILNGSVGVFSGNRFRVITPEGASTFSPVNGKGNVKIQVGGEKKGTSFSVLEGRGITVIDGLEKEIKAGEGAELTAKSKGRKTKLPKVPTILTPLEGAIYTYDGVNKPKITFQFGKTENKYHLQIAKDKSFSNLIVNKYSDKPIVIVSTLSKGTYYWNVAAINNSGLRGPYSNIRKIEINVSEKKEPRAVETPKIVKTQKIPMRIANLSGDANLGRAGRNKTLKSNSKIVSGDEIKVPYGSQLSLSLEKKVSMELMGGSHIFLKSVSEREDSGEREVDAALKEGATLIHLQKIDGKNVTYGVRAKNSLALLTTRKMKRSNAEVLVEKMNNGSTRMLVLTGNVPVQFAKEQRVIRAQTEAVFSGRRNSLPKFSKAPVTNVIISAKGKNRLFFEKERPLITYTWPEKGNRFVFEMSTNKSFSNLLVSEYARSNYFTNYSPPEGKYYWRYKGVSGKYSKGHEFIVGRTQSYSVEIRRVEIFEKEPDRLVWFDRRPPVVELYWDRSPKATTYLVEIFKDPKLKRKIFEKRVTTGSLSFLADFFKEGTYYWQVSRYLGASKFLERGPRKTLVMKRNLSSPTMRIDIPLNNSFMNTAELITKGDMFKKGTLLINGFEAFINYVGPFNFKVDLEKGKNRISYREVTTDGMITHYVRDVIYK